MPARAGRIFGQALTRMSRPSRRRSPRTQPLGIGLRLSGEAAAVARQPEALACVPRSTVAARRLCLHHQCFSVRAVSRRAGEGARLSARLARRASASAFTANSAAVLAAILPDGVDGSISTVPGAFKPNGREPKARRRDGRQSDAGCRRSRRCGAADRQAHRARARAGALLFP